MIVIDALDECIVPRFFIRGLQQLATANAIKIAVTSRKEKELVEDLRDWMSIEMGSEEVAADIESFLEYKVSKSPKLSHPLVRPPIVNLLRSRSNGMFLWVALMIKDLKSKLSVYEIQDALLALPEGLDKLYERILRRLHTSLKPSPKELCLRVLRWVVSATRPLKMEELEEALKLEYIGATPLFGFDQALLYTERDIELVCGSLLTVRSGAVQLIHLSARDFLQNPSVRLNIDEALQQYLVDVPSVSLQITSHCVKYLMSRCSTPDMLPAENDRSATYNVGRLKQSLPLLDYACFNWLKHFIRSTEKPADEYADTIQPFFASQYCLVWISLCFKLDPDCSLRLQTDIQELLDSTSFYSSSSGPSSFTSSVLIQIATEWAGNFQTFLIEYGQILKDCPSEVHFIDPERILGPKQSSLFNNPISKVSYERHILLHDPTTHSERTPISAKYQLQKPTGEWDVLGYFYLDPHRDVFYLIDRETKDPHIFVQERSTGRRLTPLADPEMDYGKTTYLLRDACMSPDGNHLAVNYDIWYDDLPAEEYAAINYTAVWAIAEKLDFTVEYRTSAWAKKLFSLTSDLESETIGFRLRTVVFAADGSLCCPAGRIAFSTGEVQPLCPEQRPNDKLRYSDDGRSLFRIRETEFELCTLEGERLGSFTLPTASKICYTPNREFIVYQSLELSQTNVFLQNIQNGLTIELVTPEIIIDSFSLGFKHYAEDKLLGNFLHSDRHGKQAKTSIFVWAGVPFKPYLWAAKDITGEIVGHFLDERSLLLYVVFLGRICGRISLESSALTEKDLHGRYQTHSRIERCISTKGGKLAEIGFGELKCATSQFFVNIEYSSEIS